MDRSFGAGVSWISWIHDALTATRSEATGGPMNIPGSAESPPLRDWSHSNSVEYDPSDDSILVSVRHQDAVVKIDRETGRLVWILGAHDHWQEPWSSHLQEPQGDLEWQFHQHGVSLTGDGTIVMFDNGNHRASVFQSPMPIRRSYSRAVEFAVDQEAMRVSQVWAFGGKGVGRYFSRFISDAVWLPGTGNVLITDGGRQDDESGIASTKGDRRRWARILEVTRTDPARRCSRSPSGTSRQRASRCTVPAGSPVSIHEKPRRGWAHSEPSVGTLAGQ